MHYNFFLTAGLFVTRVSNSDCTEIRNGMNNEFQLTHNNKDIVHVNNMHFICCISKGSSD